MLTLLYRHLHPPNDIVRSLRGERIHRTVMGNGYAEGTPLRSTWKDLFLYL